MAPRSTGTLHEGCVAKEARPLATRHGRLLWLVHPNLQGLAQKQQATAWHPGNERVR